MIEGNQLNALYLYPVLFFTSQQDLSAVLRKVASSINYSGLY